MNFQRAFGIVVGEEGGLSLDPDDRGNWTGGSRGDGELKGTKFGIAAHVYPDENIRELTLDRARFLYQRDYWHPIKGDELPWHWALAVFDCAVNQGQGTAVRLMQDAVGVTVDGRIGPRTLAAVRASTDRQFARFMALRTLRYTRTAGWDLYRYGWMTRLFVISQEAAHA